MPDRPLLHNARMQQRTHELEDVAIADALLDCRHQFGVRNRLEAVGDVRLHHPAPAPEGLVEQYLQGIVRALLGRNPKEHSRKSASKIGSIAILSAACTRRSRTAGIDSGLGCDDPGFGMNTRPIGSGR